jgi:plastocyanin
LLGLLVAVLVPAVVLAASASITIGDALDPATLEVRPGTVVTWTNASSDRHRMRTTSGPAEIDSGDLEPGATYSVTLNALGTYKYRDERNKDLSNYWGTIVVAEAPTPTPRPATPPPPGASPPPATPPPPPGDILMAGRVFRPATVTVDAGTAVRWRNNDSREHTVTATNNAYDSGIMAVGATFTRVYSTPGTFNYLCAIHPDMTGSIIVRGAGGATPPPTPVPTPTPRPTPVPTPAPGSSIVDAVDFAFTPGSIDITAGTTITWRNTGAAIHTVTASDGSFDSGLIRAGGTYQRRFATPGTYPYLCGLHPAMTGVVRVFGTGGATPPPPPPATPRPTPPPVAAGELELRDFTFVPSSIRIAPGTQITWVNTGAAPHTVTDRAGAFDSGIIARGARWSRTFATAGSYQLICSIHPDMRATLVVAAPGATAAPPATPKPVATPAPGSDRVAILDFDYAPLTLSVGVGTTVTWRNEGVAPHTVTAKDGSYDSGFLATGEEYRRQYEAAGVYEYLCAIHPQMVGTIVVGSSEAGGAGGGAAAGGESQAPASAAPGAGGAAGGGGSTPGSSPGASPGSPGTGSGSAPGGAGEPGTEGAPSNWVRSTPSPADSMVPLLLGAVVLVILVVFMAIAVSESAEA